jgi:hypothetical protein
MVPSARPLSGTARLGSRAWEGIVSDQPPWDAFRQPDPRQGQGQPQYPRQQQPYGQQDPNQYQGRPPYPPPTQPYGQQPSPQGQPPYGQGPQGPQPPYPGQQPGYVPPGGHRGQKPWPARNKVLTAILAVVGFFIVVGAIGAAVGGGGKTGSATPAPTVTVTDVEHEPGPTVTATKTVTATRTVAPTSNAQGEATQISSDGVYVVGQDIAGGTWHTSGGSQCYEATLSSTNTSDIMDNNNFAGPDTVSLAGAKAFDISGGCTWRQEG